MNVVFWSDDNDDDDKMLRNGDSKRIFLHALKRF